MTPKPHRQSRAWGPRSTLLALLFTLALPLSGALPDAPHVAAQEACPEPNNEFQQACELRTGTPAQGVLSTDGDIDAYRVEALDFHARVHLELSGGRPDHRISLVNWNGEVLASAVQAPAAQTSPIRLDHAVGPPGAYYVFVDAVTGLGEPSAPYRLSLSMEYPAGRTPRVLFASAFSAGDTTTACTSGRGPAPAACAGESGRFTIELGEGSTEADPTSAWLWVGPEASDFTFTVDTRLIKDARNAALQIDLRAQDYDHGYGVALVPREGLVVISKTVAGQVTQLASASRPDITSPTGVNRLTVTAAGTALHIGLNGQAVIGTTDSTFATGRVGFFAFTYDEPFAARIDNVLLTTPAMHPCPSPPDASGTFAPCPL